MPATDTVAELPGGGSGDSSQIPWLLLVMAGTGAAGWTIRRQVRRAD